MNIRAVTLSAVATIVAGQAAHAGGYIAPVVETVVVEEVAAPLTWKGAYVGGTLGYAIDGNDDVGYSRSGNLFYDSKKLEISGVNGGIRAGYRTQFSSQTRSWVAGAEISYEGGSIDDSFTDGAFKAENSINNVLSLRLKTGMLNNAQDTLFYGILGVTRADLDYSISGVDGATAFSVEGEGETMSGYVVGLGMERKLNQNLSLTGEWEYSNFGRETLKADGSVYTTEMTPEFHNFKIGLNYQF